MIVKGYRFFLCILIFVILAGSLRVWQERVALQRPLPPEVKVTIRVCYNLCNHKIETEVIPAEMKNLTVGQLRQLYSLRQGWHTEFNGKDLAITRKVKGLCEVCAKKTHLGEKGGFVAVIRGPTGINGGIIRVTKIKLVSLPSELREQVRMGQLDLPSEEALMQILDSFDESDTTLER